MSNIPPERRLFIKEHRIDGLDDFVKSVISGWTHMASISKVLA